MGRATTSITTSTAVVGVSDDLVEVERVACRALAELNDADLLRVRVFVGDANDVTAVLPAALIKRYLQAQDQPGRGMLVFDTDEAVSTQVAAEMLGVSRPHLVELLEAGTMPFHRVGNQRRVYVADVDAYLQRRQVAREGLIELAAVVNESEGGWDH